MSSVVIPPKPGTAEAQILDILQTGQALSDLDIQKRFHTNRGSSHIHRLRKRGYNIVTVLLPQEERAGNYGVYLLLDAQPGGKITIAAGRLRWGN